MAEIVSTKDIRSGCPRIEDTRITVLDIKRRVIDSNEDPYVVAGEYDISMADLFRALTYYYDHQDDFASREQQFAAARTDGEKRTRELLRDESDLTEQAD